MNNGSERQIKNKQWLWTPKWSKGSEHQMENNGSERQTKLNNHERQAEKRHNKKDTKALNIELKGNDGRKYALV